MTYEILPPQKDDPRAYAAWRLEDEVTVRDRKPGKEYQPYDAVQERAHMNMFSDARAIANRMFDQPEDRSTIEGYELGYYVAPYILGRDASFPERFTTQTIRIIAALSERAIRQSIDAKEHIREVAADHLLPQTPRGDATLPAQFVEDDPLQRIALGIARGRYPENRARQEPERSEIINCYMAGFSLAQMATEEVWYQQRFINAYQTLSFELAFYDDPPHL